MISPFNVYGFDERILFESIPTQRNAGYSDPADTADRHDNVATFFGQHYGVEPNIAHICSIECPEQSDVCESKDPCNS